MIEYQCHQIISIQPHHLSIFSSEALKLEIHWFNVIVFSSFLQLNVFVKIFYFSCNSVRYLSIKSFYHTTNYISYDNICGFFLVEILLFSVIYKTHPETSSMKR